MNPILHALKQGAKTYDQLKGVVGNLDHQLRYLKRTGQIVLYPCVDGPARYGLPIVTKDEPLRISRPILHLKKPLSKKRKPHGPKRTCRRCGEYKFQSQFNPAGNGKPGRVCSACRYRDRKVRGQREEATEHERTDSSGRHRSGTVG